MAQSGLTKKASDHLPFLNDQGIDHLMGAAKAGMSIQHIQAAMPADGIIVFADHGALDMASASYGVIIHNHTGTSQGIVPTADRSETQIDITGPLAGELLDVIIVGAVKGQLS